jgi:hypothetical protein
MPVNVIEAYLVSLGFHVDHLAAQKFEDAVKRAATATEKFAKDMTVGFVAAGGTIATVLTAVGAGTLSLMDRVSQADLGYQLFARRMFMGADAAKKLKIAADALGYTLEEIIWGPPELAQRYQQLIKDQTFMMKELGGPAFEQKMRNLRDIRFEFTRMGVEVQYFGMKLTESIMDKLFGGPASLDRRLSQLNEWFQRSIPHMADVVSNVLAPALRTAGSLFERVFTVEHFNAAVGAFEKLVTLSQKLFNQRNLDMVVNFAVKGTESLGLLLQFLSHPNLHLIMPDAQAGKLESAGKWIWDKLLSPEGFERNRNRPTFEQQFSKDELIGKIVYEARNKFGMGSEGIAAALAIAEQESGLNPSTKPSGKGAVGPFQVMPFNAGGSNLSDMTGNVDAGEGLLFHLYQKYGDWGKAFSHYYGMGNAGPGQPTTQEYSAQVQERMRRWQKDTDLTGSGAQYQPQSFHSDMGGVTIHINQPNATPEQIKHAVKEGIDEHTRNRARLGFASQQGSYA